MDSVEFKKIRENRGFTQKKLAKMLGITTRQVINYEQGKSKITSNIADLVRDLQQPKSNINNINIKYYKDVRVSADYAAINDSLEFDTLSIARDLLENKKIQNYNNLELVRVIGDSMYPYAEDGDLILVERGCKVFNYDIIIANIDGEIYQI